MTSTPTNHIHVYNHIQFSHVPFTQKKKKSQNKGKKKKQNEEENWVSSLWWNQCSTPDCPSNAAFHCWRLARPRNIRNGLRGEGCSSFECWKGVDGLVLLLFAHHVAKGFLVCAYVECGFFRVSLNRSRKWWSVITMVEMVWQNDGWKERSWKVLRIYEDGGVNLSKGGWMLHMIQARSKSRSYQESVRGSFEMNEELNRDRKILPWVNNSTLAI